MGHEFIIHLFWIRLFLIPFLAGVKKTRHMTSNIRTRHKVFDNSLLQKGRMRGNFDLNTGHCKKLMKLDHTEMVARKGRANRWRHLRRD